MSGKRATRDERMGEFCNALELNWERKHFNEMNFVSARDLEERVLQFALETYFIIKSLCTDQKYM
jgi:hypothetical protein